MGFGIPEVQGESVIVKVGESSSLLEIKRIGFGGGIFDVQP